MNILKNSEKRSAESSGLSSTKQGTITKQSMFKLEKSSKPAIPVGKHGFQIVGVNYKKSPVIMFTLECKDIDGNPKIQLFAHCEKKNGEQNLPVTDKLITLYEDLTGIEVAQELLCDSFDALLGKYVKGDVVLNEYQGKKHAEVNIFSLRALNIELIEDDSGVQEGVVEKDKDSAKYNLLLDEVESEPAPVPTKGSEVNAAS